VREEQGDRDRQGCGEEEREDGGKDGPEQQGADVGQHALATGHVLGSGGQRREGLSDEERRHPGEDDEDQDPGPAGGAGEDPVARPPHRRRRAGLEGCAGGCHHCSVRLLIR
jgi:hypothetical protein